MAFDEEICDILAPFVDNYKEAGNQIKRKEVIKNACEAVRKSTESLEDRDVSLPKNLSLVCHFQSLFAFLNFCFSIRPLLGTLKDYLLTKKALRMRRQNRRKLNQSTPSAMSSNKITQSLLMNIYHIIPAKRGILDVTKEL